MSCMKWLKEAELDNNTSLDDLNKYAATRNLGGLTFVCILMVSGFVGNLMVIIIYSCRMKLSSNYTVYVLCLGVLDLINCCLTMPFVVVYLLYPLNFPSSVLCKAGHFIGHWVGIGSPSILVLIAIDRYRKICQPFRRQLSEQQARVSCVIVLLVSLAFAWPSPILYGNGPLKTGILNITGTHCFKDENKALENLQTYYYVVLSTLAITISCCLLISYYLIMKKVRNQTTYRKKFLMAERRGGKKATASRKTTCTFFIVTVVYIVSTLPHDALALVLNLKEDLECDLGFYLGAVFYTFLFSVFINNVANPIIYGFSDDRFYREIRKLVLGKNDQRSENRTSSQSQLSHSNSVPLGERKSSKNSMLKTQTLADEKVLNGKIIQTTTSSSFE